MHIDPKYFNSFLFIVALIAAVIIALFSLNNRSSERAAFQKRVLSQDSLKTVWWPDVQQDDSVQIASFKGKFVVLDFWSNWSDASLESHKGLARLKGEYADTLQIIAAAVGLKKDEAISYIKKYRFPFHFVAGSKQFGAFSVPGLPALIIYNPKGEAEKVFLGYPGESQIDSLRAIITHGKQ